MRKKEFAPYLYILPCVAFVFCFLFLPIVYNFIIGFTSLRGINFNSMHFVGLKNYSILFSDPIFLNSLKNTVIFMIVSLFFQLGLGLLITILLEQKLHGHRILELIFFLPAILSSVIIAYTFNQVYEPNFGALNSFLNMIGLGVLKHSWLGDIHLALYAVLVANIYQWTGMSIIYYRVGLANIPKELYESVAIDGANFWQAHTKITIPLLKFTHLTLILLGTIGTLKFFDLVYIMTQGGPAGSTEFPMTYLYKRLSLEGNVGLASAVSIIIIIAAFLLSGLQTKLFSKMDID